jgi:parallel beta-helix repeat protein
MITSLACCNELIRLWVHHNGSNTANYGDPGAGGHDTHGVYVHSTDNVIEHGVWEYNNDRGIQLRAGSLTVHRNIVRFNTVRFNGGSGIVVASGHDNLVYNNILYRNGTSGSGDGISVTTSGGAPSRTKIYNNTIWNNKSYPIEIKIGSTETEIKNNIFWQNGNANVSNNGNGTVQSNNLASDPKFIDAAKLNFRLLSGSPAIDKGAQISIVTTDFDGVLRPHGASYDIGAFEYGSSAGVPTSPASPASLQVNVQ